MDMVESEVKATRNILGFYDVPETLERIRKAVEQPKGPTRRKMSVDRLREDKGPKVVISCPTRKDIDRMSGQLKEKGLKVTEATRKLPMNKHATADLDWGSIEIRVRFRKRARNDHECHPVLEVSPELWRRLVDAGYVYVGLQRRPVWDQSPLVQCTQCLGFGHTRKYCTVKAEICAHCGGEHRSQICEKRQKGEAPKCINCTRDKLNDTAHGAFSSECSVRNKWDAIARARVSYTLPADAAPTRKTDSFSFTL
ncbi:hypothetical protein EVAR_82171_1 [Eumeta japonica]|uniref:Nucleic-acid-binding protein from transposon X-element n=1 Tax=Eumeta variegata TaxID=151549 RepID=A0A4C1U387_EUMVA|nr:hypothetical protein EVAR_82171_1 [Eumeta japonica]